MPKSTNHKPNWPHSRTIKMTAHLNGQWCKKIAGKVCFFGVWADPDGALDRYLQNADDLHRGRAVATSPSSATTIADVFNRYLDSRKGDIDSGRRDERSDNDAAIGPAMFQRYARAGKLVARILGRNRPAATLRAGDFAMVMAHLKAKYGSGTISNYVVNVKTVFDWAAANEMIARLNFGPSFTGSMSIKTTRRKRNDGARKLLDADTIRKLLAVANPQVRAMILLGINAGFYSSDCADLRIGDIDFGTGVLTMERHKTQVMRRAVLWPETMAALKTAIAERPDPQDPAHANRVFITRRGCLWVKTQHPKYDDKGRMTSVTHADYVSQEFGRLFSKAGIDKPKSASFAWLRHTFYTVARRSRMIDAVNLVMGHVGAGMVEHYLEDVPDADLRAVANYARSWLHADTRPDVVGKIG